MQGDNRLVHGAPALQARRQGGGDRWCPGTPSQGPPELRELRSGLGYKVALENTSDATGPDHRGDRPRKVRQLHAREALHIEMIHPGGKCNLNGLEQVGVAPVARSVRPGHVCQLVGLEAVQLADRLHRRSMEQHRVVLPKRCKCPHDARQVARAKLLDLQANRRDKGLHGYPARPSGLRQSPRQVGQILRRHGRQGVFGSKV
mmetsp:Transcript_21880/g.65743  ORF Transcript_21880/g.65743 Transcript_21880/m.65743 type:complete len:203 (-) Transcript_21880:319-927(-)